MNHGVWRHWIGAVALGVAAALPVQAATVGFEDVVPNLFGNGESFDSGGFRFTVGGDFGAVDTSAGFFFAAPTGSDGQFYTGLNDSRVTMSSGGVLPTIVQGFAFAFVLPLNLGPLDSPGGLLATALGLDGTSFTEFWDFGPSDANGDFGFRTVGGSALGQLSQAVRSVTFMACLYDGNGNCSNPAGNQAQFAIDNIRAELPEPTSLALVLGAIALVGATRRQQKN